MSSFGGLVCERGYGSVGDNDTRDDDHCGQ